MATLTLAPASLSPTAPAALPELLRRIRSREARVGILGLSYVGQPLAVEFARAGLGVTGFEAAGGGPAQGAARHRSAKIYGL